MKLLCLLNGLLRYLLVVLVIGNIILYTAECSELIQYSKGNDSTKGINVHASNTLPPGSKVSFIVSVDLINST